MAASAKKLFSQEERMKDHISLAAAVLAAGTLVVTGGAFAQEQDETQTVSRTSAQTGAGQTTTQGGTAADKRGGSHEETQAPSTKAKKHKAGKHKASRAAMSATFVSTAAQDGLAEVELGRMAAQKATDPAVKSFAQRMVADHSRMNTQLQQVAQSQNMTMPTSISPKEQAEMNRLSSLSGAAFDKAYMQRMVSDHKKDVAEFENEANNGDNPQVKALAAQSLPTLQEHLKLAEETLAQLK
jgi:putative membrane protein